MGIIVLAVGSGLLGLWLYFFPSYSWHQKMTVEVEVDGQVYSGSSVVNMTVDGIREPMQFANVARHLSMQGEAVVVELPGDQYVFALLTYDAYLTGKVFHDLVGGVVTEPEKGWANKIRDVRETRKLDPSDYPMLVTFTDITDPKTVKKVDPENLGATFGPGVSLKRITLEIIDEPAMEGKIERLLVWLDDLKKYRSDPNNPFTNTLPKEIGYLRSK